MEPTQRSPLETIVALAWNRKQISETQVQIMSQLLTQPQITPRESEVVETLIDAIIAGKIQVVLTPEK